MEAALNVLKAQLEQSSSTLARYKEIVVQEQEKLKREIENRQSSIQNWEEHVVSQQKMVDEYSRAIKVLEDTLNPPKPSSQQTAWEQMIAMSFGIPNVVQKG